MDSKKGTCQLFSRHCACWWSSTSRCLDICIPCCFVTWEISTQKNTLMTALTIRHSSPCAIPYSYKKFFWFESLFRLETNITSKLRTTSPLSGNYLNQCWLIFNWTLSDTLQWNLYHSRTIFRKEKAFGNAACEIRTILIPMSSTSVLCPCLQINIWNFD